MEDVGHCTSASQEESSLSGEGTLRGEWLGKLPELENPCGPAKECGVPLRAVGTTEKVSTEQCCGQIF